MAIYTPMQVPQPPAETKTVQRAPCTPRRVHTRGTHRAGLVIDITLALIVGFGVLALLF
jgi:D-alanyl-D-alanine dipeptidase